MSELWLFLRLALLRVWNTVREPLGLASSYHCRFDLMEAKASHRLSRDARPVNLIFLRQKDAVKGDVSKVAT